MGCLVEHVDDVVVVFTDRHGGVSEVPFDSLNLGRFSSDDPNRVEQNWDVASDLVVAAGLPLPRRAQGVSWLHQVHGAVVHEVVDGAPVAGADGDALVTAHAGPVLAVSVADCAPIALIGRKVVAAVHAGWRGLAEGVVREAVSRLREIEGRSPGRSGKLRAVLGPCIHVDQYEFGSEVLARMVERFGPTVEGTTADGAPAFDLPAAVRVELGRAGVTEVIDVDVCTASSSDHFSHRRDAPTGRQAMFVARRP
ncbi:MAG: polyphenol oxidase family protein [Acidimicrobiia bacterium]|nr:polyphenol oxidase family protein [Acidimicrobiia bacterium]